MNMDGVEESPVSSASHPLSVIAFAAAAQMRPADRRESCPTAMVSFCFPSFSASM